MTITLDPDVCDSEQQARPRLMSIDSDFHRRVIAALGVVLPFILVLAAALRPTQNLDLILHSMSAYYYTSSIAFLEGALVAFALVLMFYQGYPNKYRWADEWGARVAGVAALVIALFPTYPPAKEFQLPWWTENAGKIHDWASVVMFVMFAIFALWLFRMTDQRKEDLPRGKRLRNHLYLACGLTIVGSVLWIAFRLKSGNNQIFWLEAVAIGAFSLSWLVKGGAFRRLMPD